MVFTHALEADKLLVDFLMATVSAGIGLHLDVRGLLGSGARAVAVGGGASLWMAGLTLAMITLASRGAASGAALVAVGGLFASYTAYRAGASGEAAVRLIRSRFESGAPPRSRRRRGLLGAVEGEGAF